MQSFVGAEQLLLVCTYIWSGACAVKVFFVVGPSRVFDYMYNSVSYAKSASCNCVSIVSDHQ